VNLSDKSIEKYRAIHKNNFGEEISFEEAREQGTNLVRFIELLIEWDSKDNGNSPTNL